MKDTAKVFIEETRLPLPRLRVTLRSAFEGPDHYKFAEGPAVLLASLSARPMMAFDVGHANRTGFATMHDREHRVSIGRDDVRGFEIPTVCGPFVSSGCSMLDRKGEGRAIGKELPMLPTGPVAAVGFTRPHNPSWASWFFEVWRDALSTARATTPGEMTRTAKSRLANEPQSPRSVLLMQSLQTAGKINRDLKATPYPAVARKNNALLTLFGDPTTTVGIP